MSFSLSSPASTQHRSVTLPSPCLNLTSAPTKASANGRRQICTTARPSALETRSKLQAKVSPQPPLLPAKLVSADLAPGGWHPTTEPISISSNLDTEIDQAFANVDLALKTAGGKGWSQVYSVRSFHVALDEQTTAAMVRNLRKWCGEDHMPIWTEIGVSTLALEAMRVEIEVEAYVG